MPHDSDGWPVKVYRYGTPGWGGKRAVRLPDHAVDQMRLAHWLGNDLVALAHEADEMMASWWRTRIPSEHAVLDAADAESESAWAEVQAERSRRRRRDVDGPVMDAYRDAQRARKAAAAAVKAAKDAARKADPDGVKTMTKMVRDHVTASRKALYARYADAGLYWATINDVLDAAKAAEDRVIKARAAGRPAQRRFARWDGSGGIAVQLQRATGDPRRTPGLLGSGGGKWRNVLTLEQGLGMRRVRMTTGAKREPVELDVIVHREIPADADVTGAKIVAERVAGRTRLSLHVTAKVPPATAVPAGRPDVALHLGWRTESDGGVRVAAWRSSAPVTVPDALRRIVTADSPTSGRVVLPSVVLDRLAAADKMRGVRDIALDEIRDTLAAFLDREPQPPLDPDRDDTLLTGAVVRRWKSPGRFAVLALRWRDDPAEGLDGIAEALESWRAADRRMWETEANGRAKALRHRREVYRLVAALIAGTAGRVVVDDTDLSRLQGAPKTGELLPGSVEDTIAGRRADVAAGSLREAVVAAAVRDGVEVVKVSHKGSTLTHSACGTVLPADERWLSAVVTCDGCGRRFDQDANATRHMLARAVQSLAG